MPSLDIYSHVRVRSSHRLQLGRCRSQRSLARAQARHDFRLDGPLISWRQRLQCLVNDDALVKRREQRGHVSEFRNKGIEKSWKWDSPIGTPTHAWDSISRRGYEFGLPNAWEEVGYLIKQARLVASNPTEVAIQNAAR